MLCVTREYKNLSSLGTKKSHSRPLARPEDLPENLLKKLGKVK